MSETKSVASKLFWPLFVLVMAAGLFFRFSHLGTPAFRADTILFWSLANRDVPLSDLLSKWFEVSGLIGQMPLAGFFMKLFLAVTQVPVTPFTVRVPFAIFGFLAVPMAYIAGRKLFDRWFGLALAAFVAFDTFAVYHSREAYVYAPILFGYFVLVAALFDVRGLLLEGRRPGWKPLVFLGTGVFFCCYSQVTGAFIVGTAALYLFWLLWRTRALFAPAKPPFLAIFAVHAFVVAPLLLVSWGYLPLLKQMLGNVGAGSQHIQLSGESLPHALARMLWQIGWGNKPAAWVLLGLSLVGALHAIIVKRDRRVGMAMSFVVIQVFVYVATRGIAGATYEARYISGVFPFYAVVLVAGLLNLPGLIKALSEQQRSIAGGLLCAAGVLYFAYPSYYATRLSGKPVPYRAIVAWADANLPSKAPVLVDRWFEPWNEMRAHPGTNAIYTFTVPNEPLETFLAANWRATATNFFEKFPHAALLQVAKTYWEAPAVGPWSWPNEHFARHVAITNEGGMVLREWGVASRGDFYAANTNRLIADFYYNTREDTIALYRREGRKLYVIPGEGWGYEKSGPMQIFRFPMQEFRDWLSLEQRAVVTLGNNTEAPVKAVLKVRGLAMGRAKNVQTSTGAQLTFARQQPQELSFAIDLPPGLTDVTFTDSLAATSPSVLLVDALLLERAP